MNALLVAILPFLRVLVGTILADMIRALIVNARAERGTDPALLEEIQRGVRESMARTDLDWLGKFKLVMERTEVWMLELRKDLYAATSKTMVGTLTHTALNQAWDKAMRETGQR